MPGAMITRANERELDSRPSLNARRECCALERRAAFHADEISSVVGFDNSRDISAKRLVERHGKASG